VEQIYVIKITGTGEMHINFRIMDERRNGIGRVFRWYL
jgi:hypothetical protein